MCLAVLAVAAATPHAAAERSAGEHDRFGTACEREPVGDCGRAGLAAFGRWQRAERLRYGYGMTADPARAAYWYRRAAQRGDVRAAHNIGLMLLEGHGVERDRDEGLRWLRLAAAGNAHESRFALANYLRSDGGDPVAAVALYRAAAVCGHVRSQHALANMYANGLGVARSLPLAYVWWSRAARLGHGHAKAARTIAGARITLRQQAKAREAIAALRCGVN